MSSTRGLCKCKTLAEIGHKTTSHLWLEKSLGDNMKNRFLKLLIIIFISWVLVGCSNKDKIQNNPSSDQPKKSQTVSVMRTDKNSPEETINDFFFKDIPKKKQYVYEGTIWGEALIAKEQSEEAYSVEEVKIKANLTITDISKLIEGKIYELDFTILGEKVSPAFREQKLFLWVTREEIYELSPTENFNTKDLIIDGRFDDLAYAKILEKTGQLPSDDKNLIRFCYKDMNFKDSENPLLQTEISVKNNICTYNRTHNSGHFEKYVWEIHEGLTYYSLGYGAKKSGMRLMYVK
ncbi:hypothetical protein [Acetivibrio cellulolyticus]|uniref:hypothetical protein n=1 Tax=Acetivibrio cellulolyticus TaxID=35830 RepID=UPI0001E2C229|nr:hypothetical protein [Acetivibrio cellulolyticus]